MEMILDKTYSSTYLYNNFLSRSLYKKNLYKNLWVNFVPLLLNLKIWRTENYAGSNFALNQGVGENLRSPLAVLSMTKGQEQIFCSQATGFVDALI